MTDRYTYTDPIFSAKTLSPNIKVENSLSILKVLRLISGTVNCYDNYTGTNYRFRINYTNLPYELNNKLSSDVLLKNFPSEVKIKDLNNFFKKSNNNKKFYESIEIEILKCFIAEKKERHLESFFYLYRVIEGISYSVPLLYLRKNREYNKTYSDLQSFFGKDKDGELAFLSDLFQKLLKTKISTNQQ